MAWQGAPPHPAFCVSAGDPHPVVTLAWQTLYCNPPPRAPDGLMTRPLPMPLNRTRQERRGAKRRNCGDGGWSKGGKEMGGEGMPHALLCGGKHLATLKKKRRRAEREGKSYLDCLPSLTANLELPRRRPKSGAEDGGPLWPPELSHSPHRTPGL